METQLPLNSSDLLLGLRPNMEMNFLSLPKLGPNHECLVSTSESSSENNHSTFITHFKKYEYLRVSVCESVQMWVQMPLKSRKGCWISGAGITGGCGLPDVGTGK